MTKRKVIISIIGSILMVFIAIGITMIYFTTRSFHQVFPKCDRVNMYQAVNYDRRKKDYKDIDTQKASQVFEILKDTKFERVWINGNAKGWSYSLKLIDSNQSKVDDNQMELYCMTAAEQKYLRVNGKTYNIATSTYDELYKLVNELTSKSEL